MSLRDLRLSKKMTQEKLAEELLVQVPTVRKWEQGKAIPSFNDMDKIAKILNVKIEEVTSAFAPKETKRQKDIEQRNEMAGYIEELFDGSSDIVAFLYLSSLFEVTGVRGVVAYEDAVFPFTKVIAGKPGESRAVVLMDKYNNRVVLTKTNIICITPVSWRYNVFNYEIKVNCPIFPINDDYNPDSFEQTIRVSFFY